MKGMKWAVLVVALVFSVSALAGCGVSKKKYDALLNEKVAFEEKTAVLIKAKDALKNEYDNLLNEKMAVSTKLEAALSEKKALKEEYDKILNEKIMLKAEHDKLLSEVRGVSAKSVQVSSIPSGSEAAPAETVAE